MDPVLAVSSGLVGLLADPSSWLRYSAGLATAGFFIGTLVGVTGVGAGSLTTPVLVAGFGVHPVVAVGTDLLFACITKSTAAWRHHRLGHVDWHILLWLAAGSVPAAALVLASLAWLKPDMRALAGVLRMLLSVALVISAIAIVARHWFAPHLTRQAFAADNAADFSTHDALAEDAASPILHHSNATLIAFGAVLGLLVALTSIGAGAIGVVALALLYPLLPAKRLVGTDIVHAIPLTMISGLGHLALGHVDGRVLAALLVGSIPGIAIGSRLTGRLPEWLMRSLLATVLMVAAVALWRK
jgi:uncharacterized protein